MRALALALLVTTAALAGCLGGTTDGGAGDGGDAAAAPENWAELALPYGDGHDHHDVSHHKNLSTPNFEVIGWNPLVTDYHGATSGDHLCGGTAMSGDREYAVTHSFGTDVALIVVDVTDPANPEKVGELALPNTHVYDVDVLPDASYAVLATSPLDTGPDARGAAAAGAPRATYTLQPQWRDACGNTYQGPETEAPYASGVVLVDLSDVTSPEVADYRAQPLIGAHSVFATIVGDTPYVLGSTTNLAHTASYFSFYTVEEAPGAGGKLVPVGEYTAQYPGAEAEGTQERTPLTNGHVDGWIQAHPGTGDTLAYLANWNGGLIILRIDGPGQLTEVGRWTDYDTRKGTGMTGQIHEALPMAELWGDKHYTFIGQELSNRPENRPTGQVIVLDTTNPAQPTPVARWTLPVDVSWDGSLQFSTHYIEVVCEASHANEQAGLDARDAAADCTLFVALYHGGVWAVDARPEAGPELPTLGVFIPDRESPKPPEFADFTWAPTVLDVLALESGDLVTFDSVSGAYTLRFHEDMGSVPVPDPWTADAWLEGAGE